MCRQFRHRPPEVDFQCAQNWCSSLDDQPQLFHGEPGGIRHRRIVTTMATKGCGEVAGRAWREAEGEGAEMKFTREMEAAYQRGLELSRLQHAHRSTNEDSEYAPIINFLGATFPDSPGAKRTRFKKPPDELLEEYTVVVEQVAFLAGWMDGSPAAVKVLGSARAGLERANASLWAKWSLSPAVLWEACRNRWSGWQDLSLPLLRPE